MNRIAWRSCEKLFRQAKILSSSDQGTGRIFYFRESEENLFSLTDLYKCMKKETMYVKFSNTTQFSPNYVSFMNIENKFFLSF